MSIHVPIHKSIHVPIYTSIHISIHTCLWTFYTHVYTSVCTQASVHKRLYTLQIVQVGRTWLHLCNICVDIHINWLYTCVADDMPRAHAPTHRVCFRDLGVWAVLVRTKPYVSVQT